jgi:EmrB/QacA subfamily drug resistance transporter
MEVSGSTLGLNPQPQPQPQPRQGLAVALAVIVSAKLMLDLDVTVVNVSLPAVQQSLGFSGDGLTWVVNAYALAYGSLLLLGGRLGDLLGRRGVLVTGLLLFGTASLAGGLAQSAAWLITCRVLQGAGAAVIAPTVLSLLVTTFVEGPPRDKAMGFYSAVSAAGGAVGLLLGGLLVTYADWRWVLFINVPLALGLALVARRVFPPVSPQPGRFDSAGAVLAAAGVGLLVYGISHLGTDSRGATHWTDPATLACLALAAVLLASFVVVERRCAHPLVPLRMFGNRNRVGAYAIVVLIVTGMFGVFFFLTLFMQQVWHYTALQSGAAYLPMAATVVLAATFSSRAIARLGARPPLVAGTVLVAIGMGWLSRLTANGTYLHDAMPPLLTLATGLGLAFPAANLTAVAGIPDHDAGLASSLLNISQQVGGALGLAVLGTVAWSSVYSANPSDYAAACIHANSRAACIHDQALQHGFASGFQTAAIAAALALLVALLVTRQPARPKTG